MKINFKIVLDKYSLLKNSFLKSLRLRKQKVKSIWSKANTLKNKNLIKNRNQNILKNFLSKIDLNKYSFFNKFEVESSKNISNRKVKAVFKAKSLEKVKILYKKLLKNNTLGKYKISP